jgi:hypothetical protein
MKLFTLLLFNFLLLNPISVAWGAACCGSGFVIPSIITGDDKAQFSLNYTKSQITDDVYTNKMWNKRSEDDLTTIYRFDAAHIFKDRFQLGLSLPYHIRERSGAQEDSSQGPGDLSLQLGYEFLPDWSYHPIRPKGIVYLGLITPTGRSIYESQDGSGIDARGRGFWGVSSGVVLTKRWKRFDLNSNSEVHYSFPKNIDSPNLTGRVTPGFGANLSLGAGVSYKDLRIGNLVTWTYESPVEVTGNTESKGNLKRFTGLGFLISYMLTSQDSFTLNYTDQSLLGSPYNTTLNQSLSFLYQHRLSR